MIREMVRCRNGHDFLVMKPSKYDGAAHYPKDCPKCRR